VSIGLVQQIGHTVHRHLGTQEHDKGFHQQAKTAALPRPRHLQLMDSVGATPGAQHLGHQFAVILEKAQMPPASLDGVVHFAQSLEQRRAGKRVAIRDDDPQDSVSQIVSELRASGRTVVEILEQDTVTFYLLIDRR